MRIRYYLALEIEQPLQGGEWDQRAKEDILDAMQSEASSVLCDLRRGDSGAVDLRFVDPPA